MTPIEQLLSQVEWIEGEAQPNPQGLPYATHFGEMVIGPMRLRCYQLNDGRRLFDADDLKAFFGAALS